MGPSAETLAAPYLGRKAFRRMSRPWRQDAGHQMSRGPSRGTQSQCPTHVCPLIYKEALTSDTPEYSALPCRLPRQHTSTGGKGHTQAEEVKTGTPWALLPRPGEDLPWGGPRRTRRGQDHSQHGAPPPPPCGALAPCQTPGRGSRSVIGVSLVRKGQCPLCTVAWKTWPGPGDREGPSGAELPAAGSLLGPSGGDLCCGTDSGAWGQPPGMSEGL